MSARERRLFWFILLIWVALALLWSPVFHPVYHAETVQCDDVRPRGC